MEKFACTWSSSALIACGDKEIEEEDTTTEDTDTEDTEDTGDTVVENEPLEPVAIGFEYSGIWNEAGNDGAGSLDPYLFPDLNNENGGVPFALGNLVTVTLALSSISLWEVVRQMKSVHLKLVQCMLTLHTRQQTCLLKTLIGLQV